MQDPEFLQSVLENLPGVDPNNEAIRNAMGSLASQNRTKPPEGKKEDEKKQRKMLERGTTEQTNNKYFERKRISIND